MWPFACMHAAGGASRCVPAAAATQAAGPKLVTPACTRPTAAEQGSQAYARALAKAGVLTQAEADEIVAGLDK